MSLTTQESLLVDMLVARDATIAELREQLAKADEHNGRLLRENEDLKDTVSRRKRWLESAKKEWGVGNNVSFDIIWKEALELRRDALRNRS